MIESKVLRFGVIVMDFIPQKEVSFGPFFRPRHGMGDIDCLCPSMIDML